MGDVGCMITKKIALITGITGQDGSYLAELLLKKGYTVVGAIRAGNSPFSEFENLSAIRNQIELLPINLLDPLEITSLLQAVCPDEIYNLAAQTFIPASLENPIETAQINGMSVMFLLEAIRKINPAIKFCQGSTSEQFGNTSEKVQDEKTAFFPRSPYGVSKCFAHFTTTNYRESFAQFAVSAILFNHESPRRNINFVTRKISNAVARIALGLEDEIFLGNLDVKRDWGFAADYVEAMWMMMQAEKPEDYVIATGELHSIREFIEIAFEHVNLKAENYVKIDPRFVRKNESNTLCGNSSKAKNQLNWKPSISFPNLVKLMLDTDLERNKFISAKQALRA